MRFICNEETEAYQKSCRTNTLIIPVNAVVELYYSNNTFVVVKYKDVESNYQKKTYINKKLWEINFEKI